MDSRDITWTIGHRIEEILWGGGEGGGKNTTEVFSIQVYRD